MINSSTHTLFYTENPVDFFLQTRLSFDCGNMKAAGYEIISVPQNPNEALEIKLTVEGGGNMPEAIHDFSIGAFPDDINQWNLHIEVVDINGTHHGNINTAQTTSEAEPRPIGSNLIW